MNNIHVTSNWFDSIYQQEHEQHKSKVYNTTQLSNPTQAQASGYTTTSHIRPEVWEWISYISMQMFLQSHLVHMQTYPTYQNYIGLCMQQVVKLQPYVIWANKSYVHLYNVLHMYLNLSSSKSTGAPMYLNIKITTFNILLVVSFSCAQCKDQMM